MAGKSRCAERFERDLRAIVDVMGESRRFCRPRRIAAALDRDIDEVRRDLKRLERAGLVYFDRVYRGWRMVDRLICCPDCKAPMADHGVSYERRMAVWRCPRGGL